MKCKIGDMLIFYCSLFNCRIWILTLKYLNLDLANPNPTRVECINILACNLGTLLQISLRILAIHYFKPPIFWVLDLKCHYLGLYRHFLKKKYSKCQFKTRLRFTVSNKNATSSRVLS